MTMSIKLLDRGWRYSKARGGDLLVLLGIADFANDEGIAYPSIATLAAKARLTVRNTQRAIRRLVSLGELTIDEGRGPHGTHIYKIGIERDVDVPTDNSTGVTKCRDDIRSSKGVTSQPSKPSEETVI